MRKAFHPKLFRNPALRPLQKYSGKRGKYLFHRTRYDALSLLGQDQKFRRFNMTAEQWRLARKQKPTPVVTKALPRTAFAEVARPGDRLVIMDSSWTAEHSRAFSSVSSTGVRTYTMVHDLIPLKATSTCDSGSVGAFFEWIYAAKDYSDEFLTVSYSTKRDLAEFLRAHSVERPIKVVQLAQSPLASTPAEDQEICDLSPISSILPEDTYPDCMTLLSVSDSVRQIMMSPYVLCVGTLEGRKNIWRVAMTWKYLLDQGHVDLPKLVFAGRMGWAISDVVDFLKGTNYLNGAIRFAEAPSDKELDFLYRNCEFTIMASLYEGWGLPVGEALAYGKTAVVADNSALPEVGGDLVEYCDATQIKSIAKAVVTLLDPEHRKTLENRIAAADLRSWKDVANDLSNAISAPVQEALV